MNTGDISWLLICAALVLIMTPGLAFFYGGLVRERNAINTIKMSFVALGIVAILWATLGYSLAFGPGNALIGGFSYVGLSEVDTTPSETYASSVPHLLFMVFQMMFAIITPALISGAVVGRMKFKSYILFIGAWSLFIYAPLAHWVWGDGGWLGRLGALDFAGGTVVHISAGFSALIAAIVLGPRRAAPCDSHSQKKPHNVPLVVLGATLLWFGWFGFNAGSALAADGIAVLALVNTMLGGAAAMCAWIALEARTKGRATAVGASLGAVVGLVAITPGAGFVQPMASLAIGAIAAVISFFGMRAMQRSSFDDTLDVFACHGLGGVTGALLTGVFATTQVNPGGADGLLYGNPSLMLSQVVAMVAAIVLSVGGSAMILTLIRVTVGLRTTAEAEKRGIDLYEHAEMAYVHEQADTVTENLLLGSQ
jgi:Amt family ammonium transporter